jgi:8-oxo-dGTP pyrophosphatase MutT (NUDIX family)
VNKDHVKSTSTSTEMAKSTSTAFHKRRGQMRRPLLRAEGMILRRTDEGELYALVQCDDREAFYRFPGGSVDFGETAAAAIMREMVEEFDLPVKVGSLAAIAETIVTYNNRHRHDCTLLHWCELGDQIEVKELRHNEHPDVKIAWRSVEQLRTRPVYPDGVLAFIESGAPGIVHLPVRRPSEG